VGRKNAAKEQGGQVRIVSGDGTLYRRQLSWANPPEGTNHWSYASLADVGCR